MSNRAKVTAYKGRAAAVRRYQLFHAIRRHPALYWMVLPGIVYYILFKYVPMLGIVIAFQDFNVYKGIFGSEFVGFQQFEILFSSKDFYRLLTNTLVINFYDLLIGFTSPIVLALLLNEVSQMMFKRTIQSLLYLPHFLSWVVIGGLVTSQLLSPTTGLINQIIVELGGTPIYFLVENAFIRSVVVAAGIYKEVGWGTIIYLAALAGVNPSLYEAASIDGAGRFRQVFSITLPTIMPVVSVLFLMKIGHFLDFGFDRVWVFMNGANQGKIDIFDTYVYRVGLTQGLYSYATAIGLFKAIVGLILVLFFNHWSKKTTGEGLY
ncbi:putative multiple-sugar transport system permease YteP [Paenibacillus allorhizoplanae]|uniref:Multiple-sugar transport system permease YteP n=1 Tax=Paenibacillus allorhizoplanae TaxID=2905648 RepID=A0ABM9CQ42_9BACL|nr:ABC transporter permease subunit [Paenibacillus allorhizoplanae]CAH1219615.1 putative multiple-sugar transport system permease YteP [Paenibacillus allorhizoplanae]